MAKKKDFVVFGLGKFGSSVAITLARNGYDVLGIDMSEEVIQDISDKVTHAVQADVTDQDALVALGIRNFDVAIVAIGENMQASIMATILAKEIGVPYVLAKAQNDIHKRVLEKVGADKVVFPEREIGVRIANNLISENFVDFVELSDDYSIVEIATKQEWVGKSLKELNLRSKHHINIMAIKSSDKNIVITPGPMEIIKEHDILVVVASNIELQRMNNVGKS